MKITVTIASLVFDRPSERQVCLLRQVLEDVREALIDNEFRCPDDTRFASQCVGSDTAEVAIETVDA